MKTHLWDMNNIARRMLETGKSLRDIYGTFAYPTTLDIVVWDGPNSLKARREIYPEYKRNRQPPKTDIYVNFDMVKEVLTHTPAIQITVPGYEADDVIAALVPSFQDVAIISNDRDFLQLGVPCGAPELPGVKPEHVRIYKTMVGDSSDNIPGCRNFGPKAWAECDPDGLIAWLLDGAHYEFPKRVQPDRDELLRYWSIIGFIPVEIGAEHITPGLANPAAAEAFFQKWMI